MVSEIKEKFNTDLPVFKRAVVAAAFSHRLTAVLNESYRILKKIGAWPVIAHAGEESPANRIKLEEAIDCSFFKEYPPVCVIKNGSPSDVLIQVAREYEADLIIAGALAKEGLFKYYLGSVARKLARYSPSSVLLLTEPHPKSSPITKIHCAVEYDKDTEKAIIVAAQLAAYCDTLDLYYTHSFTIPEWDGDADENMQTFLKKVYQKEDEKLKNYLQQFDLLDVHYQIRCLNDSSKRATLDFAREIDADLLVMSGPRSQRGLWDRLFPANIELALQHLPCSVLLTRNGETN